MSLHDQFETNASKEIEGVEIKYAPNKDKSVPTFIVCRMGATNKRYQKELDRVTKPYRRQMQLGTMDNTVAESLMMGVFIKTILKGWSGVQNKKGEEIPFNEETATELFLQLPDLYEDLQAKAGSAALFREEALEDEAKN